MKCSLLLKDTLNFDSTQLILSNSNFIKASVLDEEININ
jgi:hypothetical protein